MPPPPPSVWDTTCQANRIVRKISGSQLTSGDGYASFRAIQLPGYDDEVYEVEYPLCTSTEMLALLASAETTRGAAKVSWTPPGGSASPFVISSFGWSSRTDKRNDCRATFTLLRGVTT